MALETIETRIDGRIAILALNRPKVLNALNRTLMREVSEAMAGFVMDPKVLAIVVHGRGRAFSAGFDMKDLAQRDTTGTDQWRAILESDFDFIMQFWDCPSRRSPPCTDFCLAGASELALACDMTVAAEGTRFGEPEARFGSGIIALLLPWHTTPKLAKELLMTGTDQVDALPCSRHGHRQSRGADWAGARQGGCTGPRSRPQQRRCPYSSPSAPSTAPTRSWACGRRCWQRSIPTC